MHLLQNVLFQKTCSHYMIGLRARETEKYFYELCEILDKKNKEKIKSAL